MKLLKCYHSFLCLSCISAGQDATPPCGIQGCRGVGHIKGAKYTTHHTSFGCPYTSQNIHRTTSPVVDRLVMDSEEVFAGSTPSNKSNENSPTSTGESSLSGLLI